MLGLLYLNVFAIIFFQGLALWGKYGLLPIGEFAKAVEGHFGDRLSSVLELPSLFYFIPFDSTFYVLTVLALVLSVVLILGYANFFFLFVLWILQLSFVNSGQLFYSYGWETQILELTFLAFFFVPFLNPNLKTTSTPPSRVVIWAMRWELFRLMLGAGLIKIRGDECWRDLTCLVYHYETQPNPNPLSYFYHHMPTWFHYGGVLFNHFIELIVPFAFFGPKHLRRLAGVLAAVFQIILISSGNLAWLNWLTLAMCLVCFDDEFLMKIATLFNTRIKGFSAKLSAGESQTRARTAILCLFTAVVLGMSLAPSYNLVRSDQAMNTSYSSWHFINSYGAFGSVGKERGEVIIEGTDDSVITDQTVWREYEFHCAPGDVTRMPCLVSPYHYHLDWQIWFSGMRSELQEEWLFRLAVRLLESDEKVTALFRENPFPDHPPQFIRMELYRYNFSDLKEWPRTWWKRERVAEYMPAISLTTPMAEHFRK
jgi:hypothetical protein